MGPSSLSQADSTFHALRPRLQAIAYRMLGSVADAQDLVQDVWLKWHATSLDAVVNAEAWLVTATTRLAIDRLRAAKVQREQYPGIWLPEPILQDAAGLPETPESQAIFANDVSIAWLVLLERLAPEARAAFVLREVFEMEYEHLAQTLGKSAAACRQIVHRARLQLKDARARYVVSSDVHLQVMQQFAHALTTGDLDALNALLVEDATLIGDGGGKVTSFPQPLVGGERIAKLFAAGHRRYGDEVRIVLAILNGKWAVLRLVTGKLESAVCLETDGKRITEIYVQRNPDKLVRLAQAHQTVPLG